MVDKVKDKIDSRLYYFDFLRAASTFAVMVLHVAAYNGYDADVFSLEWAAMNFYNSIVRWTVPIFTMISGALFLNKEIPLKKIYGKYIFRIFTAFLFWSLVYAVDNYVTEGDAQKAVEHFVKGHYHMWFLFMISGLYMIVPFVKKIAESESLMKYFFVLAFVSAFLLPEIVSVISLFSKEYGTFADSVIKNFYLNFVAGFTGYFLLGYWLNNVHISQKAERLIYIVGILGFSATVLMSLYASRFKGEPYVFYENQSVNVLCEAVAVFVFFKNRLNFPVKFIRPLSQYSFGAYLVHDGVRMLIYRLGLNALTFTPIFSIPVISVMVFVISFAISAIINHIHVLKKYIV